MKIALEFDDGRTFECEPNMKAFQGLAAKHAFKQQFNVPPVVLSYWSDAFVDEDTGEVDDQGKPVTRQRLNPKMPPEVLPYIDEEYMAFFVWHELKRQLGDQLPSWDETVKHTTDVVVDVSGDEPDPT